MSATSVPTSVLAWAAAQFKAPSRVDSVRPLRDNPGDRGPWLVIVMSAAGTHEVVLKTGPTVENADRGTTHHVSVKASMATEAAALILAEEHQLPAPRLIAADLAGDCGRITLLTVAGSGGVEAIDEQALIALGALLPRVHAVAVPPHPDLPPRTRAREGDNFVAVRAQQRIDIESYQSGTDRERQELRDRLISTHPHWTQQRVDRYLTVPATTPLILEAERTLDQLPHTAEPAGLIHDDVALGNVLWDKSNPVLIDWEGAGSGPAGLDLGNARFEVAQHHGLQGADLLVRGWRQNDGAPIPTDLAYWDLSAALNAPVNLDYWGPDASQRRDDFLRHTLTWARQTIGNREAGQR